MTDYIEFCAIFQVHLALNLETKNGNCCSMPHNPLSPLPNELLLEITQYSISSPKELHFMVQLVSKTFAAMVQHYQQHLYKHLCYIRAKEYPFLPPIQDTNTNHKLFYVLHYHFIQQVRFSTPRQSVYSSDYYCDISTIFISANLPFAYHFSQQHSPNANINLLELQLQKHLFLVRVQFDATTTSASRGALQGPEFSKLIKVTQGSAWSKHREFFAAQRHAFEGDAFSSLKGWLEYQLPNESFGALEFRYGITGYSMCRILKWDEVNSQLKYLMTHIDCVGAAIEACLREYHS